MKLNFTSGIAAALTVFALTACNDGSTSGPTGAAGSAPAGLPPSSTGSTQAPAPTSSSRVFSTDAMVFAGDGTWATEVTNVENILNSHGATYQEVTSAQVNAMAVDDIAKFGILIFPGGDGATEAGGLTAQTHANLREAVQSRGVGYIGFCAGAFIAEAPAPAAGQDVSYGIGVVDGPVLDYYSLENQGTDIQMVLLSYPNETTQDTLWYGGPVTPSGAGEVIAKYPDGTAAISQVHSGNGMVIMSGVHPTADQATLTALGMTSTDGIHQDTAWNLINGAMHQQPLQAF